MTREAWQAWWASPMASQWALADVPFAQLMAHHYERAMAGDRAASEEVRHWGDRFGLSPMARRRLLWVLPEQGSGSPDLTVVHLPGGVG